VIQSSSRSRSTKNYAGEELEMHEREITASDVAVATSQGVYLHLQYHSDPVFLRLTATCVLRVAQHVHFAPFEVYHLLVSAVAKV
jgi:hypothetical protein